MPLWHILSRMWNAGEVFGCCKCIRPPKDFTVPRSDTCTASGITARIPHQSQIGSEEPICASFSPGEARAALPLSKVNNDLPFHPTKNDGH